MKGKKIGIHGDGYRFVQMFTLIEFEKNTFFSPSVVLRNF